MWDGNRLRALKRKTQELTKQFEIFGQSELGLGSEWRTVHQDRERDQDARQNRPNCGASLGRMQWNAIQVRTRWGARVAKC